MAFAVLVAAAPCRADDKAECIAAADQGQTARDGGRFVEARRRFATCSRAACPKVVRDDCGTWLADLEARAPSLIIVPVDARDGDRARPFEGDDLTALELRIDGIRVESGAPTPVDRGTHVVEVQHGTEITKTTVDVRNGDVARRIEVPIVLDAHAAPTHSLAAWPPPLAFVLAGVSVVGFAGAIGFGTAARSARDDLLVSCAPHCSDASVDGVRRDVTLANASLGLGLVSASAAIVYALIKRPQSSAPPAAPKPAAGLFLDVAPTSIGLSGRF